MEAMMAFGISPLFSSTEAHPVACEANAYAREPSSNSSFVSCLTSIADAIFAPAYDFLKSDFGKAELIKEYIEEHDLYKNPHPMQVSNKIENINTDFYNKKGLPTREDMLLALNDVIDRVDHSERNIKQHEKKYKDLLATLRAIKTMIMARKDELIFSPEEFAELSLRFEALHLTDLVSQSQFYGKIELLYRETTRASFELKKHIASRLMVDALKEQMTIGFYKADKDKVSKGFSWSCWIFEVGLTVEAEKASIRTNDDEGTPALSEQKAVTVSSRTDIGIKGLATGYIDGRVRHSRGKYKEGNTIEHFVEKNFSKLMQEKEFRESPLIAACASNVGFLKYASGKEDNFFVRATTRNQLGLLNDNKEVMGDFKVSRRAWAKEIASIKSIPAAPPNPTPPTFGFHGHKKTTSAAISAGAHLGNEAVGSLDFSGGGRVESNEVTAKAMKTNFCSFLTHQYIDKEARELFQKELKERTKDLVDNELDPRFQSEWKKNGPEAQLALLKDQFENYANLQQEYSFNKDATGDRQLREFGRAYGLPTSGDSKHPWLAANIMHRMAVLNASLMLEPVGRLEEEKVKLDAATKKLIELEMYVNGGSEHRNELLEEINETETLIAEIKQKIKNINTDLDKYKNFEKLLLDPPFATDSKFMKRHCYRLRELTLEWTIWEKKWTTTNTQALGLVSFAKSGVTQDYFKKHNNPLRIGTYKDTISSNSTESTEISEIAPGVLGHLEMWASSIAKSAEGLGEQLGFGGLILKTEKAEKTLERRFVMEGVDLLAGEEGPRLLKRKLDANTFTAGVKGSGHVGMGFKVSAGAEHSAEITKTTGDIYYGESFIQFGMLDMNDYDKEYLDSLGKVKTEFEKKYIDSNGEEKVLKNQACWRIGVLEKQKLGLHQLAANYKNQLKNEKALRDKGEKDTLVRDEYLCREMKVFVQDVEKSEQSEEAKQKFRVRLKEFQETALNYDDTFQSDAHLALGECLHKHDEIKTAYQEIVVKKLEDKIKRLSDNGEGAFSIDSVTMLDERKACEQALKNLSEKLDAFDKALSEYNGHDFKAIIDALNGLTLAYEQGDSALSRDNERSGLGSVGNKLNEFKSKLGEFNNAAAKYDNQLSDMSDVFYLFLNALQPHFKEKKLNSRCYKPVPMPEFKKARVAPRVERWQRPEWDEHMTGYNSPGLYTSLI